MVPDRFSPWTYTEGSAPATADEIGIDSITAEEEGYELGEEIRIAATRRTTSTDWCWTETSTSWFRSST